VPLYYTLARKFTPSLSCGPTSLTPAQYIRHEVRALIASFVVATGQVVWSLGQTRTSADWATHLAKVVYQLPEMQRYD
jgi:hypothetical protein